MLHESIMYINIDFTLSTRIIVTFCSIVISIYLNNNRLQSEHQQTENDIEIS